MKPYGFVYLTTNVENGKKYIGQARYRKNLRSTYVGSGKAIKRAIEVYGIDAFIKEVLFDAFSKDDLDWAERMIIADYDAVRSKAFYNIAPGGRASLGFTGRAHSEERNRALSEKMKLNHPTAKRITIDGITYQGVQAASNALGVSKGKIEKFLTTGIHPRDQVHGCLGKKRTNAIGKATWNLMAVDGRSHEVRNLKLWCEQNGVPYAIRDHQGSLYHGWILTRRQSTESVPRC